MSFVSAPSPNPICSLEVGEFGEKWAWDVGQADILAVGIYYEKCNKDKNC